MRVRAYQPIDVAREYRFVRETLGPNRGVFVEAIQRIGGSPPGLSWCMDFLSMVLWICYQGPAPLPRTGSCAVAYTIAKQLGYLVAEPEPNDVFFRLELATDHAHHAGVVTAARPTSIDAIAGNTSEDGESANGTGVFEHALTRVPSLVFARLPLEMAA